MLTPLLIVSPIVLEQHSRVNSVDLSQEVVKVLIVPSIAAIIDLLDVPTIKKLIGYAQSLLFSCCCRAKMYN